MCYKSPNIFQMYRNIKQYIPVGRTYANDISNLIIMGVYIYFYSPVYQVHSSVHGNTNDHSNSEQPSVLSACLSVATVISTTVRSRLDYSTLRCYKWRCTYGSESPELGFGCFWMGLWKLMRQVLRAHYTNSEPATLVSFSAALDGVFLAITVVCHLRPHYLQYMSHWYKGLLLRPCCQIHLS